MKSSIALHMKNFYKVSLGLIFVVLIMSISISIRESYPVMKKKNKIKESFVSIILKKGYPANKMSPAHAQFLFITIHPQATTRKQLHMPS